MFSFCRKGISSSALPYRRTPPSWLKITPQEVCDQICKLAKKGKSPSQIGVILRDSHGIGQVKNVTGNKILRILKGNGMVYAINFGDFAGDRLVFTDATRFCRTGSLDP